jgi:hypothetical protein
MATPDLLLACPECHAWPMAVGGPLISGRYGEMLFQCPIAATERYSTWRARKRVSFIDPTILGSVAGDGTGGGQNNSPGPNANHRKRFSLLRRGKAWPIAK